MQIRTRRLQNNRWSCVILFHNHSQISFSVNISFTLSPSQRTPCWTPPRKKERKKLQRTSLISCWSEPGSTSSTTLVKGEASLPAQWPQFSVSETCLILTFPFLSTLLTAEFWYFLPYFSSNQTTNFSQRYPVNYQTLFLF